ncbi:acyl-CoA dehydrogenase family protein [Rhodococcus jostii]|uniref:acyl-CoA dehydrogenase family protein n=1 Tax=Rhodococcus jostii TaxID=132919 RepID=UPI003657825C
MDADDVAQVVESLRQALTTDPSRARETLTDFGWSELLEDDSQVAVSALFSLRGELLTPGSALDQVLLQAAGIVGLATDVRVVLPASGVSRPSSRHLGEREVKIDGVVQSGSGRVLVPCVDSADELTFAVCGQLEVIEGEPLDDAAGWRRVETMQTADTVFDAAALGDDPAHVWDRMVAAGRRALSHELVAIAAAMEVMTVEHVRSRNQFGQALGSFQAVKHQLADVHLWREVAALSAAAAWEDQGPESAALAMAAAVRSTRTARAVCQQLLGGMGFTWEHDFHRYLRRALTLEPLLGGASVLHAELGAAVRSGSISDALISL